MKKIILVAGATGSLGSRITKVLLEKGAEVRIIVRPGSDPEKIRILEDLGAKVFQVNIMNPSETIAACSGVSCVVSALAGLREVVIDTQKALLDAALAAGVPRFIPSDYSLDFTRFSPGENRNLDWRREFHAYLDQSGIAATSIFNGAFAELLTGQMPMILFKKKLVLYWGKADHPMSFTTMDDTAVFTANAALDVATPRYLHIAGDLKSPAEMRNLVSELSGEKFRLFRAGGKGLLGTLINIIRTLAPGHKELYPAFQGMQYMRNMIDDRALLKKKDNARYPGMYWTTARDVLTAYMADVKL